VERAAFARRSGEIVRRHEVAALGRFGPSGAPSGEAG